MQEALDSAGVRLWCATSLAALDRARDEIDALNVYPVPDGDTGTNLYLTMKSVVDAVESAAADLPAVAAAMAHGALMGARGNSGVILSQLLRGFGEGLASVSSGRGGDALAAALARAAELGYAAVAEPVEGTMLTVARVAAEAARDCPDRELAAVADAAVRGAAAALARTPEQLPALAAAGVVDAGGRGYVVLLDALHEAITGERGARHDDATRDGLPAPLVNRVALAGAREAGSDAYAFEVMHLLDAPDDAIPGLRERLAALGDSVAVVGGGGLWNVHVHVNDVGAAIEAALGAGRPHRIAVTHFERQVAERNRSRGDATVAGRAVVAALPRAGGLLDLFRTAGAVVVTGAESANPSTAELLAAIRAAAAAEVVLLPNDANVQGSADQAAALALAEGVQVAVIPTRACVQGLSALAVSDPARRFDDDIVAMSAAAGATRWAEVTLAARDAMTSAGICRAGDVLGLMEGDVAVIGRDVAEVAMSVLDRFLIGGGELVTLITGAGAGADLGSRLNDYLHATRPDVEVSLYDGGQPHYPLLLGVE